MALPPTFKGVILYNQIHVSDWSLILF